jgi:hypothetical protein
MNEHIDIKKIYYKSVVLRGVEAVLRKLNKLRKRSAAAKLLREL